MIDADADPHDNTTGHGCPDVTSGDRALEIFEQAIGLADAERDAYLDAECADDAELRTRVDQLLKWDSEAGDFLEHGPMQPPETAEHAGLTIGPYTLIREIGEGGMAVVWLASQLEPVSRHVAVKMLKPGLDTRAILARFELERQVLAHLDHPHVVQVLDAGMSDRGRPFFVMEYIEGDSLTEFCKRQALSLTGKLALFVQVCDVVRHAHQKGVIHRDIKPSNILVAARGDSYAPKVIDFGIAKAVAGALRAGTIFTEQGQVIGTLEYMSPEQCAGDAAAVDVRTDVYSLGVVLYVMLCDCYPYDTADLPLYDVMRVIRTQPARRPTTIDRRLPRDLETILLKAIEKRPEDRYQSVFEFKRDIERFLAFLPIDARPRSVIYHVRMFSRRHRPLVAAGVVAVASLLIGAVVSGRSAFVARAALHESEQRERDLEIVTTFQESLFSEIDLKMMGEQLRFAFEESVEEAQSLGGRDNVDFASMVEGVNFTSIALRLLDESMLQRAHASLTEQFADQPVLRARLLQQLAATMNSLGLHDSAHPVLVEALQLRREELGLDHRDSLETQHALGAVESTLGRYDDALVLLEDAVALADAAYGADDQLSLRISTTLGGVYRRMGDLAGAERVWSATLERQRRILGSDDPETLRTMNNIGIVYALQGRPAQAEATWRELLDRRRRTLGPDDPLFLGSLSNLGLILAEQGKFEEAIPLVRDSLDAERRNRGDGHTRTLLTMAALAEMLRDADELEESRKLLRECVDGRIQALGPSHVDTLRAKASLAYTEHLLGEPAEASMRQTLDMQLELLGRDHPDTLVTMDRFSIVLEDQGRHQEALDIAAQALEASRRVFAEGHWETGMRLSRHAALDFAMTQNPDARASLHEGHTLLEQGLGASHPLTRAAAERLATFYAARHAVEPDAGHDAEASRWKAMSEHPDD